GFWPVPAVRIWPRMTSVTWPGSTLARFSASVMATCPRKEAATPLKAPLNAPIGVRAAPTITTSVIASLLHLGIGWLMPEHRWGAQGGQASPGRGSARRAGRLAAEARQPAGERLVETLERAGTDDHADMSGGGPQLLRPRQRTRQRQRGRRRHDAV